MCRERPSCRGKILLGLVKTIFSYTSLICSCPGAGLGKAATSREEREDLEQILESGYAYGLGRDRYVGWKEQDYWSMALTLHRVLEYKVSKVGNNFYGHNEKMGHFIFCMEQMQEAEARYTMRYTMDLQKYMDNQYDQLYLAEVSNLHVCNLVDGLQESSRLLSIPISQEQRKSFYHEAIRRQLKMIG